MEAIKGFGQSVSKTLNPEELEQHLKSAAKTVAHGARGSKLAEAANERRAEPKPAETSEEQQAAAARVKAKLDEATAKRAAILAKPADSPWLLRVLAPVLGWIDRKIVPVAEFVCFWENILDHTSYFLSLGAAYYWGATGGSVAAVVVLFYLTIKQYQRNTRSLQAKMYALAKTAVSFDRAGAPESVEWLNTLISRFWFQFEPELSEQINNIADDIMEQFKPAFLEDLRLSQLVLGSQGLRIHSWKTVPIPAERDHMDEVVWEIDVSFIPFDLEDSRLSDLVNSTIPVLGVHNAEQVAERQFTIELLAKIGKGLASVPFPVLVKNFEFSGKLRLTMTLGHLFPHIKFVRAQFVEAPKVDFVLKPLKSLDIFDLPGLSNFIHSIIDSQLDYFLVKNDIPIDVYGTLYGSAPEDVPVGILEVRVVEAQRLENTEVIMGKADPFVRVMIAGKKRAETRTIHANLNPRWDSTRYIIIYKSMLADSDAKADKFCLEVFDNNAVKAHTPMGATATLPLKKWCSILFKKDPALKDRAGFEPVEVTDDEVAELTEEWGSPDKPANLWKPLKDGEKAKGGKLRFSVGFSPILKFEAENEKQVKPKTGIVKITIHQAKDLTAPRGKPNAFCVAEFNDEEVLETKTKKRSGKPSWGNTFSVIVDNTDHAVLKLTIWDRKDTPGLAPTVVCDRTVDLTEVDKFKGESEWKDMYHGAGGEKIRVTLHFTPVALHGSVGKALIPTGVVKLHVKDAKGLKNVEAFGGKSDPYVNIRHEGKLIARTSVKESNLNPRWNENYFVVVDSMWDRFDLEVMDREELTKDRSLGKTFFELGKFFQADYKTQSDLNVISSTIRSEKRALPQPGDDESSKALEVVDVSGDLLDKTSLENTRGVLNYDLMYFPCSADSKIDPDAHTSGIIVANVYKARGLAPLGFKSSNFFVCGFAGASDVPWLKTHARSSNDPAWNANGQIFIKDISMNELVFEVRGTKDSEDGNVSPVEMKAADEEDKDNVKVVGEVRFNVRDLLTSDMDPKGEWFTVETLVRDAKTNESVRMEVGEIMLAFKHYSVDVGMLSEIYEVGKLHVDVVGAKDLPAADMNGASDPYCVVNIGPAQAFKTATVHKSLSPTWDESFTVDITERNTVAAEFLVYDYDKLGAHDLLGSVHVALNDLPPDRVQEFTLPLENAKRGELHVRLLFSPQKITGMRREMTVSQSQKDLTKVGLGKVKSMMKIKAVAAPMKVVTGVVGTVTGGNSRKSSIVATPRSGSIFDLEAASAAVAAASASASASESKDKINAAGEPTVAQPNLVLSASQLKTDPESSGSLVQIPSPIGGGDFTVTDLLHGTLNITIGQFRNIKFETTEAPDMFVKAAMSTSKKTAHKTKTVKKTAAPAFNETFTANFDDAGTVGAAITLSLVVKKEAKSAFSGTAADLGQATVNLVEELGQQRRRAGDDTTRIACTAWYPLMSVRKDGGVGTNGEIEVTLSFEPASPADDSGASGKKRSRASSVIEKRKALIKTAFKKSSSSSSIAEVELQKER